MSSYNPDNIHLYGGKSFRDDLEQIIELALPYLKGAHDMLQARACHGIAIIAIDCNGDVMGMSTTATDAATVRIIERLREAATMFEKTRNAGGEAAALIAKLQGERKRDDAG